MKYGLYLRVVLFALLRSSEYRVQCNAATCFFFIILCNERGKLPSLYTQRYVQIVSFFIFFHQTMYSACLMFQCQFDYHTCKFVLISLRLCFGVKEKFSTPKMLLAKERTLMTAGFNLPLNWVSLPILALIFQHK